MNIDSKRLPSTDKSVWGAEFKVGDKVKIREDFSKDGHNVNFTYTIQKIELAADFKRPENTSGKLYTLSNGGGNWEGKDLELAAEDSIYKPSVKEQLDFFQSNIKDFYQGFVTKDGQVIAVAIDSIKNNLISVYFLNYDIKNDLEWVQTERYILNDLVTYLNDDFSNYNQNLKIEFSEFQTRYAQNLGKLSFKEFILSFNQDVNIEQGDSEKFDLIFEDIKIYFGTADVKVVTTDTQSKPEGFKLFIENTKKEIEQLIFLRSLQSPLDFEENIKLNQLLASKQEQLDKEIFGQNEIFMSQDNIFDDLFEQSFTPIQNSYNNIFAKDENGSDFFTPNGERSSLNDAENALIRSSLFVEWFGDWQLAFQYKEAGIKDFACSKVLSPKFEPQVVWHGTGDEFSYFRFDNFPAAYFAVNKAYSQWFADLHAREGEGYTIPFFLSVNNPLDLTLFETRKIDPKTFFDYIFLQTGLTKDELDINPIFADSNLGQLETWMYLRNNPKMLKKLADSKLFDGIHFYETNPSIDESEPFYKTEAWIIFSPHQAKLADPSRGLLLFSSLKSFLLEKGGKI
jgi:hypothetical protein